MKILTLLCVFVTLCSADILIDRIHGGENESENQGKPLSDYVTDPAPWLHYTSNSEQRNPLYLGSTPRELCLDLIPLDKGRVKLYEALKDRGEKQAGDIYNALVKENDIEPDNSIELECWPVNDDFGQLTWAFARWKTRNGKWTWLDKSLLPPPEDVYVERYAFLPDKKYTSDKESHHLIFGDVLKLNGLYDKPLFGDCIWTEDGKEGAVLEAWVPTAKMNEYAQENKYAVCRVLPQPLRLNGKAAVFLLSVDSGKVKWSENIEWKKELTALPDIPESEPRIKEWPENFNSAYKDDVLALDGETEAVFPVSGSKVVFKNKNNIDKDNQLLELVSYLEERYKILGIKTYRQEFYWRGMKQANLIAVIPGSDPTAKPVLMADHIDTAFCEDIYEKTGERVSAPGADDNCSATAALLVAAGILKDMKPKHDIWLVHLTGEEFPADDLGATYFVSELLKDKIDIEGLILLDMIGHREDGTIIFQINPGDSAESLRMAKIAFDASKKLTQFQGVIRTRYQDKSYLYNTDGLIFSETGFPVVYLNEHINKLENLYRKGYHHTTDTSAKIDWNYAVDITKVAIETTAVMADASQVEAENNNKQRYKNLCYEGFDLSCLISLSDMNR